MRRALALIAVLALSGCAAVPANPTVSGTSSPSTSIAEPTATHCSARGSGEMVLPDQGCTPGATNPDVTQATIGSTICAHGWTRTIRPPESYTGPLKLAQLRAYGYADQSPHDYEEDHLISLELGGAPSDPRNLWPEPGRSPNPKDRVENQLRREVCAGTITLARAQTEIATNWMTAR